VECSILLLTLLLVMRVTTFSFHAHKSGKVFTEKGEASLGEEGDNL